MLNSMQKKVLFICLGNICRSPTAEAVFRKLIHKKNLSELLDCDSAGISSYHEGQEADPRMRKIAQARGYTINSIARGVIIPDDFEIFNYLIVMDESNFENLTRMDKEKAHTQKIFRMRDFCKASHPEEIPDPYYGKTDGFEEVLDLLEDACEGLLEKIHKDILKEFQ
jgi:protein-tyrosine phosphatase